MRKSSLGWVQLAIGVGVFFAGLVFLYLWQGSMLTLLRAERARLTLTIQEVIRHHDWLTHQVIRAYSQDALAARAKGLGMVPFDPDRTRYLLVDAGGTGD